MARLPALQIQRSPRKSIRWTIELMLNLAVHRINTRYKETLLGFGWIFLQPVALTGIFHYIRKVSDIPTGNVPYALFAAVGMVAWSFTSLYASQSVIAVSGVTNILKRVYIPKIIFPVSVLISAVVDLCVMTLLLVGLFIYYHYPISWTAIWLPAILFVHILFLIGLGCLISLTNVFLKDVGQAIPQLLWLWFFACPVFYPQSMVPEDFNLLSRWNPMAGFIESYRSVLLLGQAPPLYLMGPAILVSVIMFIAGVSLFGKLEGDLVDLL